MSRLNNRIWFLRNGNHLCGVMLRNGKFVRNWSEWWGTAGDEYGYKTGWIHLGVGVIVWRIRRWTYAEVLEDAVRHTIVPEWAERFAQREWHEYEIRRLEDGVR